MSSQHRNNSDFARQLSWTQASLDLCLDMERNQSDSRFASQSEDNEIVYVFDESVFELFVGGVDEPPAGSLEETSTYFDRRRSVGIFNVREWREKPSLAPEHEASRISLNRQTAILTSEWLFSESLPAMKRGFVYISKGHLLELRSRWEKLATYYRKLLQSTDLEAKERTAVRALLDDRAALALEHNGSSTTKEVDAYLDQQLGELRSDLEEFWRSLTSHPDLDEPTRTRSFWRYAFSRRLAHKLSDIRAIGPLAQLVRINSSIAGRLRLLDFAGEVDSPDELPSSERQPFWHNRIIEEIERRERFGLRVDRPKQARQNDAATLALVQSLANTAVRQNQKKKKRYVFVTADSFIIDVYRAWHCDSALNFEPFVIRPVRHFAPLLNIANMADAGADSYEEMREKRDIFPALQTAINPFLLTLNLYNRSGASKKGGDLDEVGHDDTVRWPREMFALHLRRILQEYRLSSDPAIRFNEQWLRGAIADRRYFSGAHFQRLIDADEKLRALSEGGRQIERSAIGLGLPWLGAKLDGLKVVADVLEKLVDRDESALAAYIQEMVDDFGNANLDLQARSLSIADHLESVVRSDNFGGLSAQRVPLTLDLSFVEKGRTHSVAAQALLMVEQAHATDNGRRVRGRRSFALDLQDSSLAQNGGHRLFALFACVALRLGEWDLAQRYAAEALYRVGKFMPDNAHDIREVQYLWALCTRFQIGAGVVRDAAGFDITEQRYDAAKVLLVEMMGDGGPLDNFVRMRAASELVALMIFGSIWSAAKDKVPLREYPKLAPDAHLNLLEEAWKVTRRLRDAIFKGVAVDDSRALDRDFVELAEQVVTNGAALVTLTHVVSHQTDDPRMAAILGDAVMTEWLDCDEPKRPAGETYPPITAFYRYWYLRVRGHERSIPIAHFRLDVSVDLIAQKLFQLGG